VRLERKWKVLLLVSVGMFMAFLDAPVVSVAFPAIERSFPGATATTVAWTLDAYFIGFATFLVVGGRAADRYGRRKLFIAGLVVFSAASLACAAAPTIGVLIAARAVQASAAAMVVPAGQALMVAEFPADEQSKAIGILAAVVGLGTALAPAAGGCIVQGLSWRWIFWISSAIALLTSVIATRSLEKQSRAELRGETPDVVGAAVQGGALGVIVLAILKSSEWGVGDARTLGLFALGAALLALFIRRCQRHAAPVLDLSLFRDRRFAFANLASIGLGIGLFGGSIASVLYFTHVWGWSVLATGAAFVPGGLAAALTGKSTGDLAQRVGARAVGTAGCVAAGAGLLLIALMTTEKPNFAGDFLPGQIIYSVGIVAGMTALLGTALTSVPASQYAVASGLNNALRQVGGAIGVAVVIAISGNAIGSHGAARGHVSFVFAGAALLVSGVTALLMASVGRAAREASEPG
jgi:EmrB/QacA subfamily drug resistance transporter